MDGLYVREYGNTREYRSLVTAVRTGLTLFGTIKGEPITADQYVVGDWSEFNYGLGERNWWNTKP